MHIWCEHVDDVDGCNATANIALDGLAKYADTSAMKPTGKSLICRVSAAVRRRLLVIIDIVIGWLIDWVASGDVKWKRKYGQNT